MFHLQLVFLGPPASFPLQSSAFAEQFSHFTSFLPLLHWSVSLPSQHPYWHMFQVSGCIGHSGEPAPDTASLLFTSKPDWDLYRFEHFGCFFELLQEEEGKSSNTCPYFPSQTHLVLSWTVLGAVFSASSFTSTLTFKSCDFFYLRTSSSPWLSFYLRKGLEAWRCLWISYAWSHSLGVNL